MRRLSQLQLAVMHVLWARGRATVAEVQEAMQPTRPLAYSTVATVLRRLEEKGVVRHSTDARTFIYEPAVPPEKVGQSLVGELVEHVFSGSPSELVNHLLETQEVDRSELQRIHALIEQHLRGQAGESTAPHAEGGGHFGR
jgi:BlaI family penicillinase repressor